MIDQRKQAPIVWKLIAFTGFLLAAVFACGAIIIVASLGFTAIKTPLLTSQQTQPQPSAPVEPVTPVNKNVAGSNNMDSLIAFVKTNDRVGGEYNLYLMRPDGRDQRQLTSLPGLETSPTWSANGQSIAFIATQDSVQPNDCATGYVELRCNFEIYTIDVDGGHLKRITTLPSYERGPTWSPDGKYIAFSSREAGAPYGYIYVIGVDGTGLRALTRGEVRDNSPSWSPDGKQIVYMREICCESSSTSTVDIYVMDADGTDVTRLTHGERPNVNPAWSPDGRSITWMTLAGDSQNPIGQIAVMNSDGTDQTIIPLNISVAFGYPPAWSPDSQQVMFVHQEGHQLNLYRVKRDGTNLTQVTDGSAFFSAPAWSPVLAEP